MNDSAAMKFLRILYHPITMIVTAGLIYYAAAIVSIHLTRQITHATLWLPNALLLVFILRSQKELTWAYLAAGLFANFFANNIMGVTFSLSISFALINGVELSLVSLYYYYLYTIKPIPIEQNTDVVALAIVVLFGCVASGLLAAGLISPTDKIHYFQTLMSWTVADLLPLVAILPFGLSISIKNIIRLYYNPSFLEYLLLALAAGMTLVMGIYYLPSPYIIISFPLLFVALRFGFFATSLLVMLNTMLFLIVRFTGQGAILTLDQQSIFGYSYFLMFLTLISPLIIAYLHDQRKIYEDQLRESEERFRGAMQSSAIGMALVGLDGKWLSINKAITEITGYSEEELLKLTFQDITYPDDLEPDLALVNKILRGEIKSYDMEKRYIRKNGKIVWVLLVVSTVFDRDNKPLYFVAQIENIDRRKQDDKEMKLLTDELYAEKERLRITLQSIDDAVITVDSDGKVSFVNSIAEKWLGYSQDEAIGKSINEICHLVDETTGALLNKSVAKFFTKNAVGCLKQHAVLFNQMGSHYYIHYSISPLHSPNNKFIGSVMVLHDMTSSREMQIELTHQASHDELTGLINRRQFEVTLNKLFSDEKALQLTHTLCYLDLDRFKFVNDTAGHEAGDQLLKNISELLKNNVRSSDIVARLGGDEFALLLPDCPIERGLAISEKVINAVKDYKFLYKDKVYQVGVSIGLVNFVPKLTSITDVLTHSDVACYAAKHQGGNAASVYEAQGTASKYQAEFQLISTIKQALEANKFQLYASEIRSISSASSERQNFEILIRMIDDDGQMLMPKNFISIAERHGFMTQIDLWVVNQLMFRYGKQIAARPDLGFSINLSASSLSSIQFLDCLKNELSRTSVLPNQIGFEFTEKAIMNETDQVKLFLQFIKNAGFFVSLDDFGSNFSSFAYLRQLLLKFIKIDGELIKLIDKSEKDKAIIETINDLAHKLDAKTIAEHVETDAILKIVQSIGIDYVQGYAISHPVPLSEILEKYPAPVTED